MKRIVAHLVRTAACIALIAAAPGALAQALLTFMKIDGIPGESVNLDHRDEIDLIGYSQNFGTRNCSRVVALKYVDIASPALIARAAGNQAIASVIVSMRRAGEGQRDFFKATLDQALVERIELGDQNGQLVERVVLAPRSITIEYRRQDPRGTLTPPIVTSVACS